MADLSLTFVNLYEQVERFLGTYNSGSAVAAAVTDAKFIVNRAYARYVSYFDWTFLYQEKTLETIDGVYKYTLPSDFSYLVYPKLTFDSDDAYAEIQQRTSGQIKQLRSDAVFENAPIYFALQAGAYYKTTGQGWDIWFYPTPDTTYSLQYLCKINPEKLVNDADIPIGGADMSDCLLQLCLAYAEVYKDEGMSVNNQVVTQILEPAKVMDNRRRSSHLGNLGVVSMSDVVDIDSTHRGTVIVSS
jgi:hypothetical protein